MEAGQLFCFSLFYGLKTHWRREEMDVEKTYSERTGRAPLFEVVYRFLSPEEGGRKSPPHQHTRWDFLYEGDDPHRDPIWMIWPEFISPEREVLPQGEVPMTGRALMFIVNTEHAAYHRARIAVGGKGAIVEGPRTIAVCEVVAVHGLSSTAEHGS